MEAETIVRVHSISCYDNGTRTLGLRYEGYEIIKGKYSIPGLPAMYADENEAETLVITLRDDVQDVRVKLYYGVVKDLDVITRSVSVENHGQAPVQLERVCPSAWTSRMETGTG